MREIKFRGKSKMTIEELDAMDFEHENGWFTGNFIMHGNTPYIVGDLIEVDSEYIIHDFWVPIYPESVGQYTGLQDKHGKEIYEGDIVRKEWTSINGVVHVLDLPVFQDQTGAWRVKYLNKTLDNVYDLQKKVEIIGKVYENSELLEGL